MRTREYYMNSISVDYHRIEGLTNLGRQLVILHYRDCQSQFEYWGLPEDKEVTLRQLAADAAAVGHASMKGDRELLRRLDPCRVALRVVGFLFGDEGGDFVSVFIDEETEGEALN